jgi:hypothetical protein
MTDSPCVFIGGSHDGEVHTIRDDMHDVCMAVYEPLPIPEPFSEVDAFHRGSVKTEWYRRELFRGESVTYSMMILRGVSIDSAIRELLTQYARKGKGES